MKKLIGAVLGILLVGATVSAQDLTRAYTRPSVPYSDDLARLNLQLSWRNYVPTDGKRDGIFSFHLVEQPKTANKQILLQMRSGAIFALDAMTGMTQWRARVGNPYAVSLPLGYNSKLVFAVQGIHLYALNRATGQIQWEYFLPHGATTAPAADEERFYVTLTTGKVQAYSLPNAASAVPTAVAEKQLEALPELAAPTYSGGSRSVRLSGGISMGSGPARVGSSNQSTAAISAVTSGGRNLSAVSAVSAGGRTQTAISAVSAGGRTVRSIGALASAAQASENGLHGLDLPLVFEYSAEARLESPLLLTNKIGTYAGGGLLVPAHDGTLQALRRIDGDHFFRISLGSVLSARLGQYRDTAYVPCEDATVHALDIASGRVLWQFLGSAPAQYKPAVNDEDVYVTPERGGLYRIDRNTGESYWRNPSADRFLAANKKFVYVTDRSGRLLVLDRSRGTQQAAHDLGRNFVFPITNELTDRLFLASNDGLLVCLHDRDYPTPLIMKTAEELQPVEDQPAAPKESRPTPKPAPPAKGEKVDKKSDKPKEPKEEMPDK
jgi:outer membrane protein assembly factor BamB